LKKVDLLANEVINKNMAPGLQILISKKGKVVYQKSFGHHTQEKKTKVSDNDLYDLASLTKILASTPLLMKMADNADFSLNTTLSTMLSEYKESNKAAITVKEMF